MVTIELRVLELTDDTHRQAASLSRPGETEVLLYLRGRLEARYVGGRRRPVTSPAIRHKEGE